MSRRTGPKPRPLAERLWEKVDRRGPDECWPWTGATNEHGYGSLRGDGRTEKAHRVVWRLTHPGEVLTSDDHICHHCDNPPCCNPAHLYRGDYASNTADKVRRGRQLSGERMSAVLRGRTPSGDEHWTRKHPERVNLAALHRNGPWNKGRRSLGDHGTVKRYRQGCKCEDCREANAVDKRRYRRAC